MAFDPTLFPAIVDALVSEAQTLGVFERVNGHEPKNKPGTHLTAAVWLRTLAPARSSGLASTSAVLVFTVRIYTPATSLPADAIDPAVYDAMARLMASYSGDFTLGGLIRNVDLLGMTGTSLSAQTGYLDIDNHMFRIADITVPMIVNDVFDQAP
jgi:hypothetical protein